MQKKRIIALAMLIILMLTTFVSVSYAVCAHTSAYITYTNKRVCSYACGFLGAYKQNVWDETTTYRCSSGSNESFTRYDMRNGTCC
jgi:hypothetical protein